MIRYFDSSALAKRYVRAEGSADVSRWIREARPATCRLAEAELSSAFARRVREGTMSEAARSAALARLRTDLVRIEVVEIVPAIVDEVHDLLGHHPLRAADAIHLAAALYLRERVGREMDFVVYDDRLANAARAERLRVLP